MRTLRLLLEYDGSDFVGWQCQDHGRTIQGELERALQILLKESIRPIGSGRTDAGTHALGQVAHFQTQSDLPTACSAASTDYCPPMSPSAPSTKPQLTSTPATAPNASATAIVSTVVNQP